MHTDRLELKEVYERVLNSRSSLDEFGGSCQTNQLKHQKPWERGFYEAIRERHCVRAASRLSLNVLRFESDLCELKRL